MPRKSKFTREEKIAAVTLVEEGRTPRSVAHEYGIHENTLYKWRQQFEMDSDGAFTPRTEQDGADELSRLKRRLKQLELENEFLKKAAAYFAKDPR